MGTVIRLQAAKPVIGRLVYDLAWRGSLFSWKTDHGPLRKVLCHVLADQLSENRAVGKTGRASWSPDTLTGRWGLAKVLPSLRSHLVYRISMLKISYMVAWYFSWSALLNILFSSFFYTSPQHLPLYDLLEHPPFPYFIWKNVLYCQINHCSTGILENSGKSLLSPDRRHLEKSHPIIFQVMEENCKWQWKKKWFI